MFKIARTGDSFEKRVVRIACYLKLKVCEDHRLMSNPRDFLGLGVPQQR
jgi:hypothetical protein